MMKKKYISNCHYLGPGQKYYCLKKEKKIKKEKKKKEKKIMYWGLDLEYEIKLKEELKGVGLLTLAIICQEESKTLFHHLNTGNVKLFAPKQMP